MAASLDAAESADFVELLPPEKLCETNSEMIWFFARHFISIYIYLFIYLAQVELRPVWACFYDFFVDFYRATNFNLNISHPINCITTCIICSPLPGHLISVIWSKNELSGRKGTNTHTHTHWQQKQIFVKRLTGSKNITTIYANYIINSAIPVN